MSALAVFLAGLFVSTICGLAITFSYKEVKRLRGEADQRERRRASDESGRPA